MAGFWQHVWVVPAVIAFVVMLIFLIFFRDEKVASEKEVA
jgi:hypothetical protein